MDSWQHSGFHVYYRNSIMPDDEEGLEIMQNTLSELPISGENLYITALEASNGSVQVIYTERKMSNTHKN